MFRERDFNERRAAAEEAKKALLDKFKSKPAPDDPRVLARQAERKAILEARAVRDAERARLKQERLEREARERAVREERERIEREAAEAIAREEAQRREQEENERAAVMLADEAARKAKRDARYAARKARK